MSEQFQPDGSEQMLLNLLRGKTLEDLVEVKDVTETNLQEAQKLITDLHSGSHDLVVEALRSIIGNSETRSTFTGLSAIEAEARPHHVNTASARVALQADVPVWLHGEAGSGKTTTGEVAAKALDLDVRSISLGPTTSKADLLGYRDATGEYHDTGFRRMYEDGGVFIFDEIDNAHPSILTILNSSVANSIGEFPDSRVHRSDKTRFVATANTIGRGATAQYVGRAPIDAATIDRFAFIPMDIDPALEESLILGGEHESADVDIAAGEVPDRREWLAIVRANRDAAAELGIRTIISQRASLYGVRLAELGVGKDWLREMLIYKGMNQSDREKLERKAETLVAAKRRSLSNERQCTDSLHQKIEPDFNITYPSTDRLEAFIDTYVGRLIEGQQIATSQKAYITSLEWQIAAQHNKSVFSVRPDGLGQATTSLREAPTDLNVLMQRDDLANLFRHMDKTSKINNVTYTQAFYAYVGSEKAHMYYKTPNAQMLTRTNNTGYWYEQPKKDGAMDVMQELQPLIDEFKSIYDFYPGPTSLGWWILNREAGPENA